MLTREEDIDAHALKAQGWTITAIARHLGRDRKTIRDHLSGKREVGVRVSSAPDAFAPFAGYCAARLKEDPHLWASALFDEVKALGFGLSYQSFTRHLRERDLRPACEPCHPAKGRPVAVIDHPSGEETQWDWLELPNPPALWDGYGKTAYLLVGALAHSGKWRGVLAESDSQPHFVEALHGAAQRLGGCTRDWRFDRMATVVTPTTGNINATFSSVAKHYGVHVVLCPPRRGNRKGVVEKANHSAAQRWWRSLPDDVTVAEAQRRLDEFCEQTGDIRTRVTDDLGTKATVGQLAAGERLRPLPATPFPATVSVTRLASAQALVSFRGNRYSVAPELANTAVTVSHRLGSLEIHICTPSGIVIEVHRRAADGAGVTIRSESNVTALNTAVLAAFSSAAPHRSKVRIPPGADALAAAAVLRGENDPRPDSTVTDLSAYAAAAENRRNLP